MVRPCLIAAVFAASAGCEASPDDARDTAPDEPGAEPDDASGSSAPEAVPDPCQDPGTPGATATCIAPTFPPEHYVAEALRYFDTLDVSADPASIPDYGEQVARWEWPPWFLLTGLGRTEMIDISAGLRLIDPSTVPERDCRYFDHQPFARCYVVFEYAGGRCPIYEEFVFDAAGRMTFIEAWSDLPGLRPQTDAADPFGERGTFYRLSTRVPGLGHGDARLDLAGPFMAAAAAADPHVADFATRAADWQAHWIATYEAAPADFFARGCGW
jgi:hypothetical protein